MNIQDGTYMTLWGLREDDEQFFASLVVSIEGRIIFPWSYPLLVACNLSA
jgi:hypothetical protein